MTKDKSSANPIWLSHSHLRTCAFYIPHDKLCRRLPKLDAAAVLEHHRLVGWQLRAIQEGAVAAAQVYQEHAAVVVVAQRCVLP
jgi:MOSC domain-containing protein YiiM